MPSPHFAVHTHSSRTHFFYFIVRFIFVFYFLVQAIARRIASLTLLLLFSLLSHYYYYYQPMKHKYKIYFVRNRKPVLHRSSFLTFIWTCIARSITHTHTRLQSRHIPIGPRYRYEYEKKSRKNYARARPTTNLHLMRSSGGGSASTLGTCGTHGAIEKAKRRQNELYKLRRS